MSTTVDNRDGLQKTVAMLGGFVREMQKRMRPDILNCLSKTVSLPSGARFEIVHTIPTHWDASVTYFDALNCEGETMTGPVWTAILDSIAARTEIEPQDAEAIFDLGERALALHIAHRTTGEFPTEGK